MSLTHQTQARTATLIPIIGGLDMPMIDSSSSRKTRAHPSPVAHLLLGRRNTPSKSAGSMHRLVSAAALPELAERKEDRGGANGRTPFAPRQPRKYGTKQCKPRAQIAVKPDKSGHARAPASSQSSNAASEWMRGEVGRDEL
jgi:hypothetical protein